MKRHIIKIKLILSVAFSAFYAMTLNAGNALVKEITPYTVTNVKTWENVRFIDNNSYAKVSDGKKSIETFDVVTGKLSETIFNVENTRENSIMFIEGFILSPDNKKIIVWCESESIYRRSFKAKYYVYDTHSKILKKLSEQFDKVQVPVFSNDSRMIAFVAEGNIYLKKLDYNTEIAVTADAKKGNIINGATDWTYEEEFQTVSLMKFSTDNTALCYVKFDESEVPWYSLLLYGGICDRKEEYAYYPGVMSYKYPVAGKPNSKVSLHCYEISNRKTKQLELQDNNIEYIPRIDFTPEDNQLLVTTLNREQNKMDIYSVNPKTTLSTCIFTEKSPAWISPSTYEDLKLTKTGFVLQSNRTGWNQLYLYAYNGTLTRTLTTGDYDVTAFYGIDDNQICYYQAAFPTPINRTVYKVDLKGKTTSLSKETGFSSAQFSPDCKYAYLSYSDSKTLPNTTIINNAGKELKKVIENDGIDSDLSSLSDKEFVKVLTEDGIELNGYIIKPANFDASKKYPVVMYQYSGPESQTVLNKWSLDWENYFASKQIIVFCVDGRGTFGRGTSFMYPVYKKLGYYETLDQIAAARWIASQPWVDRNKIGITGWSYGGYETLMCLQAQNSPFVAGVAIAPVTDWRFYDTVYSERYMSTPQQNLEGYINSAPLNFASSMNSDLLLMYGTADDNVHPSNSLEYSAALQYEGKLFDMMVFTNKNHSIYGCNARSVVYANMLRFFMNKFKMN